MEPAIPEQRSPASARSQPRGSAGPTTSALVVRTRAYLCAIPISAVVETMRALPIRPAPGAPPFVRGIAIIRGDPLPVIDLGALLGAPSGAPGGRFVTVKSGEGRLSLEVDAVVGVRAFHLDAFAATPSLLSGALPEQVERLGVIDGEALAVLGAGRLLSEDALRALTQGIVR